MMFEIVDLNKSFFCQKVYEIHRHTVSMLLCMVRDQQLNIRGSVQKTGDGSILQSSWLTVSRLPQKEQSRTIYVVRDAYITTDHK